jgi:hypothetical protein
VVTSRFLIVCDAAFVHTLESALWFSRCQSHHQTCSRQLHLVPSACERASSPGSETDSWCEWRKWPWGCFLAWFPQSARGDVRNSKVHE